MYGWHQHRSAQPVREQADLPLEAESESQEAQAPGVIPPVTEEGGGRTPSPTASDQAYGVAVPRTEPSKKGKDKTGKYRTKAWATTRQFEQLSSEQKAMLEDLAVETAKERRAVPRNGGGADAAEGTVEAVHEALEEAPIDGAPVAPVAETAVGPTETSPTDADTEAVPDGPEPTAGALLWGSLDAHRRAGFLNITAAMRGNHFDLAGLKLFSLKDFKHAGIQQDRLMFRSESAQQIKANLDLAIRDRKMLGQRGFKKDKPLESEHPGMAEW